MQKNYSIIIPHKNIPDLLQRCLASIPRRGDVQIIVVDDNSDPDKVDFEHFPGLGDSFVEVVFTKEGKGAGYARNVGLTKVTGKWLLFADADDYFVDGFLQCLDKYKESEYDLVYFDIIGIYGDTKWESDRGRKYNKLLKEAICGQKHDECKYKWAVVWGKMYKHSLIRDNNITFDETMIGEDRMFSFKTAYYARKISFDENKIYTSETRQGSLVTLRRTLDLNFDRFFVLVRTNAFLRDIKQKNFKRNLIIPLFRLINTKNMAFFIMGIELIKENDINLGIEIFEFCKVLPNKIFRKIGRYLRYNKNKLMLLVSY